MYLRKQNKGYIRCRLAVALIALLVLAGISVGGTFAWLNARSQIYNHFTMPDGPAVKIEGNGGITNTGAVPGYIRVAVVATENGAKSSSMNPFAVYPAEADYTVNKGANWFKGSDGFYYYSQAVPAGNTTTSITVSSSNATVNFLVQIIQADPRAAVIDAWGVTVSDDGTISK